jgi:hypothetical protein
MEPSERIKILIESKASHMQERLSGGQEQAGSQVQVDPLAARKVLEDWPNPPREVAEKTIEKYGLPNEATYSRLIWYNNGPWKRTEIQRDELPHKFPTPHTDYISQFIDYAIPAERASDITAFDGSVLIDRTRGEVGARCDMEAMNILSLNLMHEIITNRRTVAEAREKYAEQAAAHMMDREAPYIEQFLFDIPKGGTADYDEANIGPDMLSQMKEKMKDMVSGSDRRH